jgi:acetoacetyl-CoA synthetase
MNEEPIWTPSPARVSEAQITSFISAVEQDWGVACTSYSQLHTWSISESDKFWLSLWDFGEVVSETRGTIVLRDADKMPGAIFFPEARLNFAENLLRRRDDSPAIIFRGENGTERVLSFRELYGLVSQLRQAMIETGIHAGDRVAAILPNIPEAVACMLAAASIGAIWSSCSPDFGTGGIMDRFGQIEPKLLLGVDKYFYNGKEFDCRKKIADVGKNLNSVSKIVILPFDPENALEVGLGLTEFIKPYRAEKIKFTRFPFNHPLYILFSSGTTGVPKCIVHGAGGTLLQHLKEHLLHTDTRRGDRIFYYTTLGWMMWNWLASALAAEATLVLYDGGPFYPSGDVLFDFAEEIGITHFGTSAKFLDSAKKAQLNPSSKHKFTKLRTLLSTGSPLVPESFDYVYRAIKEDLCLSSISGGTDIVGCFAAGNPMGPVLRGELQAKCLGMNVGVLDPQGRALIDEKGELACLNPFPSMPIGFWNDPGDKKFNAAYFERFPGVWHHGDWAEVRGHGGVVIYGRSDATLNPGGVRIGTAEIYRQVEQLSEIEEAITVGQDTPDGDVRIVLFVKLRVGHHLNSELKETIRKKIRLGASPRHAPEIILEVSDIPRTKSGKITELAVREIIHGRPVLNTEALANPETLQQFQNRKELSFDTE